MTDTFTDVEAALDRVIAAARAHLDAVKAADGATDDDSVWDAYVSLNNATHDYDELLNEAFGEVTPWDLEAISAEEAESGRASAATLTLAEDAIAGDDPYPQVVSVRQRRDYRVPSVAALLRLAELGRAPAAAGEQLEPIETLSEAILELLQSGDGSLGMLDLPELEPLDGVVIVAEVAEPLNPQAHEEVDAGSAFALAGSDRALGRLDERTVLDLDEV
jgi:hypothetical protein